MNNHHPVQTESQQPATEPVKRKKKPWFNQGWIWLIVAAISISVIYFGFLGLTEQVTEVNQSIQENTIAIQEKSDILTDIKQGIQQLVVEIKDSVDSIIHSI